MLTPAIQEGLTLLLLLILALAVYTDLRRHKIPNWLTFGGLSIGLIAAYLVSLPSVQVGAALKGALAGLLVFLPFFLSGGMGAGDVKLMAAIGSFIGPMSVFISACLALIAGGCIALLMIIRSGEVLSLYRRYLVIISTRTFIPAEAGSVASRRFPFSLSIAVGTLVHLGLSGQLEFNHLSAQIGYQLQMLGVVS
ncbi:A24 family peptidase [Marinobacterium stanieri]|uniref:Prepilin peptidase CpaA n=1 Tax=Marinobacterium stanieri TaxID=49186 RepID=A0A1N6NJF3_9GAMM|nr:prepilin peptidase [Marinobacterium stanieri]SIP92219.1 prepilin peptidase CpaA [Marinobacterium stanieri]